MAGTPLIRFNHVMRDAVQSLIGTNCSADEILEAYAHTHEVGTATIQTGGGTFFDIFAKKGRKEWDEVEKILTHFKDRGVRQTALIRGDCLFGYKPYSYDVVKAVVREYARMGMNEFQNFHGLNDVRVLEGVARAVKEVREEEGHDIIARGTICIEDNKNITLESCLAAADALIKSGHNGFYLKSASGRTPKFLGELVTELSKRHPEQSLSIHIHSTYGEAPDGYVTAARARVALNLPIEIDTQNPAMAGNTAHPSIRKMYSLFKNDPDETISSNVQPINFDAIDADIDSLYDLRFAYRDFEARYNPVLLEAMRKARAAGGASATLKSIPGLVENLSILLQQQIGRKPTWDDIQTAVYDMQARILEPLGDPTQVTPYAFFTTLQAAFCVVNELQGKDRWAVMIPEVVDYMTGEYGLVPESVDPDLQRRALQKRGLVKPKDYIPSHLRDESALDEAKDKLRKAGIEEPTDRQAVSAVMLKNGVDHVAKCARGENTPAQRPALPDYAQPAARNNRIRGVERRDVIHALGGLSELEKMAQVALFRKQLDDNLNKFPAGVEYKKEEWYEKLTHKLQNFFTSIPGRLEKAGVPGFTERNSSDMARQWRLHDIQHILTDIFDHRAPGLFNDAMSAIAKPGAPKNLYKKPYSGFDDDEPLAMMG